MAGRAERLLAEGRPLDGLRRAAIEAVLDHLPEDRADAVVAGLSGLWRARVSVDADPGLLARPVAGLPGVAAARAAVEARLGWRPEGEGVLALHDATDLRGLPPLGWSDAHQRDVADLDPDAAIDRVLVVPLLHAWCGGPSRSPGPGWPCWTLVEAAVTHVHRRCAPDHVLPPGIGGLPAARGFAAIGAWLAARLGEDAVTALARTGALPPERGAWAQADLQAWQRYGGAWLGPAWSDPFAWLKLVADDPADAAPTAGAAGWAAASRAADRLARASATAWPELAAWETPLSPSAEADLLALAVASLFVEDAPLAALYAAPADPPGGQVVLDVEGCAVAAAPRSHHRHTEPARGFLPPPWCARLHARGLRRLVADGVTRERRDELLDRLNDLAAGDGPLPAAVGWELAPSRRAARPASRQLRPHEPILVVGGEMAEAIARRLHAAGWAVVPPPSAGLGDARSGWAAPEVPVAAALVCWDHSGGTDDPRGAVDEVVAAARDGIGGLRLAHGPVPVALALHPQADDDVDAAALTLAAHALRDEVTWWDARGWIRHDRPDLWPSGGPASREPCWDALFEQLLGAWADPGTRAWRRGELDHPFLRPAAAPWAWPGADAVAEVSPAPAADPTAWLAELDRLVGELPVAGQEGWFDAVDLHLRAMPVGAGAATLAALTAVLDAVEDAEPLAAGWVAALRDLAASAPTAETLAPPLRVALVRQWIDALPAPVPEGEAAAALAAALLDGRSPPRRGQILHTPWERALGRLLDLGR